MKKIIKKEIDKDKYLRVKSLFDKNCFAYTRPKCPSRVPLDVPLAIEDYVNGKNVFHLGASRGGLFSSWMTAGSKSLFAVEVTIQGSMSESLDAAIKYCEERGLSEGNMKYSMTNFWSAPPMNKDPIVLETTRLEEHLSGHEEAYTGVYEEYKAQAISNEPNMWLSDEIKKADVIYSWSHRHHSVRPVSLEKYPNCNKPSFPVNMIKKYFDTPVVWVSWFGPDCEDALKHSDDVVEFYSHELEAILKNPKHNTKAGRGPRGWSKLNPKWEETCYLGISYINYTKELFEKNYPSLDIPECLNNGAKI